MNDIKPSKFIDTAEVMTRIGISRFTIWKMVKNKQFPEPRKVGKLNKWLESDIERYIAGPANSTTSS